MGVSWSARDQQVQHEAGGNNDRISLVELGSGPIALTGCHAGGLGIVSGNDAESVSGAPRTRLQKAKKLERRCLSVVP